jgi:hypothetical protein
MLGFEFSVHTAYVALTLRRRPNDQLRIHEMSNLAQRAKVPTVRATSSFRICTSTPSR